MHTSRDCCAGTVTSYVTNRVHRCRAKLEALQSAVPASSSGVNASGGYSRRGPSLADRRAEDLLKRLEDEERYNRGGRRRRDEDEADKSLVQRLMDQIDHADVILQEKIKTVSQLEQKLMIANNQREKAEHRWDLCFTLGCCNLEYGRFSNVQFLVLRHHLCGNNMSVCIADAAPL